MSDESPDFRARMQNLRQTSVHILRQEGKPEAELAAEPQPLACEPKPPSVEAKPNKKQESIKQAFLQRFLSHLNPVAPLTLQTPQSDAEPLIEPNHPSVEDVEDSQRQEPTQLIRSVDDEALDESDRTERSFFWLGSDTFKLAESHEPAPGIFSAQSTQASTAEASWRDLQKQTINLRETIQGQVFLTGPDFEPEQNKLRKDPVQSPEQVSQDPEQAAELAKASKYLAPGIVCKVVVCKSSGSRWELCRRKYDSLSQPLEYHKPLVFQHTSHLALIQAFQQQEMQADLLVEQVQIKSRTLADGQLYHWVELVTARQRHRILFYPVAPLPERQMAILSCSVPEKGWHAQRILGLMEHPLTVGQGVFQVQHLLLCSPVKHFEPTFDIETRVRQAQPLFATDEHFRLWLQLPWGTVKARLDFVEPLQPEIEIPVQETQLSAFLAAFAPHWISRWQRSTRECWYFSSRFADRSDQVEHEQVIALQVISSDKSLQSFPWRFQPTDQGWLAQGLKNQNHSIWQPALYFQCLLKSLPLALTPLDSQDFFAPLQPFVEQALEMASYQDPQWAVFQAESEVLSEVFQLLAQQLLFRQVDPRFVQIIRQLLNNRSLRKNERYLLKQRFEEYQHHLSQAQAASDQEHYIFVFWQSFFQMLFQSLNTPANLTELQAESQAYMIQSSEDKPYSLQLLSSTSQQGDTLHWAIGVDQHQNLTLLDLVLVTDHLPRQQPAFNWSYLYQHLSSTAQDLIQPNWQYFLPLRQFSEGMNKP